MSSYDNQSLVQLTAGAVENYNGLIALVERTLPGETTLLEKLRHARDESKEVAKWFADYDGANLVKEFYAQKSWADAH